jgi:hypothetical protein
VSKSNITKSIAGRQEGESKEFLYQEQTELKRYFTAEELKTYESHWADFGKQYLQNVLDVPRQFIKESDRKHNINLISVFFAFLVVLGYFGVVFFLLYKEQYAMGSGVLGASIVAILTLVLNRKPNQKTINSDD